MKAKPDPDVLSRIGELVDQEKELRTSDGRTPLIEKDADRLAEIEVELGQCWDLLNQRRALREFGLDPGRGWVRDEDTIENYSSSRMADCPAVLRNRVAPRADR